MCQPYVVLQLSDVNWLCLWWDKKNIFIQYDYSPKHILYVLQESLNRCR